MSVVDEDPVEIRDHPRRDGSEFHDGPAASEVHGALEVTSRRKPRMNFRKKTLGPKFLVKRRAIRNVRRDLVLGEPLLNLFLCCQTSFDLGLSVLAARRESQEETRQDETS